MRLSLDGLPKLIGRHFDGNLLGRSASVRSKTDVATVSETLCNVLRYNLVVLIHEMHELGIDPIFPSSLRQDDPNPVQ